MLAANPAVVNYLRRAVLNPNASGGRLLVRQIDCQGRFSQPPGFHVAYHPDNRATRSVGEAGVETPADGALAWPEASCYAFAHNHDAQSVGAVALIEIAAVNDGDPEGAKIITCHHLLAGNDAWDCGRLSLDGDIATDSHVAGAQRQAHVPARRTNSRQRSKPLEHLLLELDHPSLILISRLWQVHIHGQDVFGIKTGIDPRVVDPILVKLAERDMLLYRAYNRGITLLLGDQLSDTTYLQAIEQRFANRYQRFEDRLTAMIDYIRLRPGNQHCRSAALINYLTGRNDAPLCGTCDLCSPTNEHIPWDPGVRLYGEPLSVDARLSVLGAVRDHNGIFAPRTIEKMLLGIPQTNFQGQVFRLLAAARASDHFGELEGTGARGECDCDRRGASRATTMPSARSRTSIRRPAERTRR